jgi:hypothetical protein
MLLEAVDKKGSGKAREGAVNYPRKSSSAKVSSGRYLSTTSSDLPVLQHSMSYSCVYDGVVPRELRLRPEDSRIQLIPSSDFTKEGNTFEVQNKTFDVIEDSGSKASRYEDINMNVTCDDAWSCPRICINTTKENRQQVTVDDDSQAGSTMEDCPVIRLSLRKPREWNWRLTTSSSSPAIIFPVIRLTDERGDVLLDTGEKTSSIKDIDNNGNTKEYPSGLGQRRRYRPTGKIKDEQRFNEATSEGPPLGKCSEQKRKGTLLKNISLEKGEWLTMTERDCKDEVLEAKRSCCKNRRTQCHHSSLQSVSGRKSQPKGCVIDSHCKEKSRNKANRRVVERRRNWRHSSSSDSSPEVLRRTRRWGRDRGRIAAASVALYWLVVLCNSSSAGSVTVVRHSRNQS